MIHIKKIVYNLLSKKVMKNKKFVNLINKNVIY